MDLFNREATESEKAFLKNRIRAIFGSNEMLAHGIIKGIITLLFIFGGFSTHLTIMGVVFFACSTVATFLMFYKMQGERKYSPIGAKIYSVLTLVESIIIKVYLIAYCAFIIVALFGMSLFGKFTQEAAVIPYEMGFWSIFVVIGTCIVFGTLSRFFALQRRFAENVYDCVDAELVFYSTERSYAFRSYVLALVVLIYNVFKMISSSWSEMYLVPAKLAMYLDSGVIVERYNAVTFIVLLLLSAHLVLGGRLAMKYMSVVKKLEKRVNERHIS